MDRELVNEVSEVSDLVKRLRESATEMMESDGLIEDIRDLANAAARIEQLERALKEIIEQDDVGDLMYRKDGPCAVIARIALGE